MRSIPNAGLAFLICIRKEAMGSNPLLASSTKLEPAKQKGQLYVSPFLAAPIFDSELNHASEKHNRNKDYGCLQRYGGQNHIYALSKEV